MWRDIPPAAATIIGIMGTNIAIWALWKLPPAWRMLNRYFISVPLYPYAMSVVGSVFSHQQFKHLLTNTVILWLIGLRRKSIYHLLYKQQITDRVQFMTKSAAEIFFLFISPPVSSALLCL